MEGPVPISAELLGQMGFALGWIGVALQWFRARRGFSDFFYYPIAIAISGAFWAASVNWTIAGPWFPFVLKSWPTIILLIQATLAGTATMSNAAKTMVNAGRSPSNPLVPLTNSKGGGDDNMKGIVSALVICLTMVLCKAAWADPVLTPYIGVNSISYTGDPHLPSDFEGGGGGSISLSPHISGFGAAYYGFGRSYLRGAVGATFTVSDVNDPNFSVGLGGSYNASSEPAIRPEEVTADATLGWRPYPLRWPRAVFFAQGSYGFTTERAFLTLGVRYALDPI